MKKRVLAFILVAMLCLPCLWLSASAEAGEVIFEESFDDYDVDVNATATHLKDFFVIDANAIGDGYVKIKEDATGNLYLMSHVFTQVYTKAPVNDPYILSLTVVEMQGGHQAGLFLHGTPTDPAFYEGDGGDPDYPNSTGLTGVWLYAGYDKMDINIKSYDKEMPNGVANNTFTLALPEDIQFDAEHPLNMRFEDDGAIISIFAEDQLLCTLHYSEEGRRVLSLSNTAKFSKSATLYDARGEEIATVEDTLMCLNISHFGWATRVANLSVDNVTVQSTATAEVTETSTEALTETETATESAAETETETATEAESEIPTETEASVPTDAPTQAAATTATETTGTAVTAAPATEAPSAGVTATTTVAPTASDTTNAPAATDAIANNGCRSVVGLSGLVALLALAAASFVKRKRK